MDSRGNRILRGFVAVEGLDGAGTTTQVALISAWLRELGVRHFPTREPTDGPVGQLIREILISGRPISGAAFTLLFAADRAEHCHVTGGIVERHAAGEIVVSDRYLASSLAYQSLQVPRSYIEAVNNTVPLPSRVIFLTTPVPLCQQRLRSRGRRRERFDDEATQRRVLTAYDAALEGLQAQGVAVHRIDGSGTREEVFSRLWPALGIR